MTQGPCLQTVPHAHFHSRRIAHCSPGPSRLTASNKVNWGGGSANLDNLLDNLLECINDALARLGTGLDVQGSQLLGQFLALCARDGAPIRIVLNQVGLVANYIIYPYIYIQGRWICHC